MRVSIIIRSFNDKDNLKKLLEMLDKQTYRNYDLIFLDNESTDGTKELIEESNYEVNNIAKGEYIPGKVLNKGVHLAKGDIVVFNNSDCIPCDSLWLERLISPLLKDNDRLCCFANQLPRPDADILVRKDHERAFGKELGAQKWPDFFSLASSAFHRDMLLANPFDECLRYSEDVELFKRLKRKGFKKYYISSSKVEHSHNYTNSQLMKRFYNEGVADCLIFKGEKYLFRDLLIPLGAELFRDFIYLKKKGAFSEIIEGCLYRTMQRVSYYVGFNFGEGKWI